MAANANVSAQCITLPLILLRSVLYKQVPKVPVVTLRESWARFYHGLSYS